MQFTHWKGKESLTKGVDYPAVLSMFRHQVVDGQADCVWDGI